MRFSLGTLFRALTLCGVVVFAVLQFGPLAAARDIRIGLALVLALQAWIARSPRYWLAAGMVGLLGFVPSILAAGAPHSLREAICMECGMRRELGEVCGWTTRDQVTHTESSHWAAPLVPPGHRHVWKTCSSEQRSHWFGMTTIACGGPGEGAFMAWQLARLGKPAEAERVYREYQSILQGKSTKSMAVHRNEVNSAVNTLVQARR
jgi:hypothetical protein